MTRKKLIEVALPLEAINVASAREKSIRHGHPSTLHLWWARRPLAACRAVLFASLVDDPGEYLPPEEAEKERQRLFRLIEQLVLWENSTNEHVLGPARLEIARSVARNEGLPEPETDEDVRRILTEHAPPVLDPFCGGGSIPLEAQRLGLRVYASDLNPVAVLITKALIEIPPRFAGQPPVNPVDRARGAGAAWKGAAGLAADVRYYGKWMRDQAEKRIGHLYPKGPNGETVIAWLWARTVKCPNPACGARMPLVRSFWLSTKQGKHAWVEPVVDRAARTVRFEVRTGVGAPRDGTVDRGGAVCVVCGTSVPLSYVRAEGKSKRFNTQLMAVVVDGMRGREYLAPSKEHETVAAVAFSMDAPDTDLPQEALGFRVQLYGMTKHRDLFTPRQLATLTTFSELVDDARNRIQHDALAANQTGTKTWLVTAGTNPVVYANAVATYLSLGVSRLTDICNAWCIWENTKTQVRHLFTRQAIPMVWDFAEPNVFGEAAGDYGISLDNLAKALAITPTYGGGTVRLADAREISSETEGVLLCTDPPYYDNVAYADLSDFFYVWLRRSLSAIYPDIFSTLLTPKSAELVADPFRHGGSDGARDFFESGLRAAFARMRDLQASHYPLTIFYAFKQSEGDDEQHTGSIGKANRIGLASTGWETMLEALLRVGFSVVGTWPMRSELSNRMRGLGSNALASSIVLVCRPRPEDAPLATRRELTATLKKELPEALRTLQHGNVAPVDLAQAVIGPGMAVFSRYAKVLASLVRASFTHSCRVGGKRPIVGPLLWGELLRCHEAVHARPHTSAARADQRLVRTPDPFRLAGAGRL